MLIEQHYRLRQYPNQFLQFCLEIVPFLEFVTRPAEKYSIRYKFHVNRCISQQWKLFHKGYVHVFFEYILINLSYWLGDEH